MDGLDSKVRLGIIACLGGFATGIASYAAINAAYNQKPVKRQRDERRYGELLFTDAGLDTKEVTAFSDITALVGSVSENQITEYESTKDFLHFEVMENYPNTRDNKTLMAKYMTPEIYESYWNVETQLGFSFDHLIQSGLDVPQFPNCGFTAGDEECYDLYSDFIDPIITEKHNGFMRGRHQHIICLQASRLSRRCSMLDPSYIEAVSFTAGRSISEYRFLPACNRAERRMIENHFRNVFENISINNGIDFSGEYFPIGQRNDELLRKLPPGSPSYWMEKPTAPVYVSAGITRDWPDARGIFISNVPGVYISVNRDDHLRIFCRETHADVARIFAKFCSLHRELEDKMADEGLKFATHDDYGFLLWYPSVIGTGLKICMSIRLKHLSQSSKLFDVMRRLRLRFHFSQQPEKAQVGWVEIYNGDRLGFSEIELVDMVADGAHKLIELEKRLERSLPIDHFLPAPKHAYFEDRSKG